jgi:hypothetical protein
LIDPPRVSMNTRDGSTYSSLRGAVAMPSADAPRLSRMRSSTIAKGRAEAVSID